MNVAVFGGTGGTGRLVLEEARSRGHAVTVVARDPSKLQVEGVTVVVGDATDAGVVRRALAGQDAVISTIGAPASERRPVREDATRRQVEGMAMAGVSRLVSLSSFGVGDSARDLPWFVRYLVVPLYLRRAFADHDRQEALIRSSGLDWTVVRPPFLTDGPRTATARVGVGAPPRGVRMQASRADVARFLVDQLDDRAYLRQAVWIAGSSRS